MTKKDLAFFSTLFNVILYLIAIPHAVFLYSRAPVVREAYEGGGAENFPLYVCLVAFVCSAYSYIRIEVSYNAPLRERFWRNGVEPSLKSRFSFLIHQREFWIKTIIIALIYLFLPLKWSLRALAELTQAVTFWDKLPYLAVLLPTLFVLAVFAHLSSYKRWGRNKDPDAYGKKRYTVESTYANLAYLGGSGAFMVMLPFLAPIFIVIYMSLTVGRVIGIVVLLSLPFVFRSLRALSKRRSFLRSLKELCDDKGYTVSEIQKPYLSLFKFIGGESFTLSTGEKSYSCKLVSAQKKGVPIALAEDGTLSFIHSIHLRRAVLYQYTTTYSFDYESEKPKILIINPVPKLVYVLYDGKTTEIDNGSTVGGYKFYAATGFLRAAELNILDKRI
ncbi:MAG: hypothetical protein E7597_01940 [Ruminococcaceae bacterium]|nr:hypothetical protein [Oscillospiraceae bacterium]